MRLARSNDVWRGLYKGADRPLESISLTYRDTPGGPELPIRIDAPLSLLCGENGVGKSRAMRAIHTALGCGLSESDFRPKVGPSAPEVLRVQAVARTFTPPDAVGDRVELNDAESLSAHLTDEQGASKVHWFDPTLQIPYLLHILRHDKSLSDLWEGVKPRQLTEEELEDVSALVGRSYSALSIYEIGDYKDHDVVPYFRATSHGETYGAEEMGLGELSLLFIYWMLGRISSSSVLLIEEPETFIAPHSQRMLIDIVARDALEKHLFVVLTSHSGVITERVPKTHVDLLTRRGREVTFSRDPSRAILTERLGLVAPRSVMCLVEDVVAAAFVVALLEAGNSKYLASTAVHVVAGEGEIARVLRAIQFRAGGPIRVVGIFDGDRRGDLPEGLDWPTMCLPSDLSPEHYLHQYINAHHANLPQILERTPETVAMALATADGMEIHAWLRTLCVGLQMSVEELIRKVARSIGNTDGGLLRGFVSSFERAASA